MTNLEKGILIFTCILGFVLSALLNYFFVKWKKKHGFKTEDALFEKMFDKFEAKHNPNFDFKTSVLSNKDKNNIYGYDSLENEHKKLVDKGLYDVTSFEEEELEEDDYYYEDER